MEFNHGTEKFIIDILIMKFAINVIIETSVSVGNYEVENCNVCRVNNKIGSS